MLPRTAPVAPCATARTTTRAAARAAALYAIVTVLLAYPLSLSLGNRVASSGPDTDLFVWSLSWDAHALATHPWSIFDANMYFPERHTLAYSENLLGSSLLAAPVIWVTGNAVLAMNLVALAACVLCGVGAFLLASRLGIGVPGAVLAGLVFAFSPPRFFRLDQLHLATIQWLPFSLAFAHGYVESGRRRDLWWATAFFTLQALSSGHGVVFLVVALVLLAAYQVVLGRGGRVVRAVRDLGFVGLWLLVPAMATFVPYLQVQQGTGLRRTLENTTVTPSSFLASPSSLHTWLLSLIPAARINETADAYLFPGFLVMGLALAAWVKRPGVERSRGRARPLFQDALAAILTALACASLVVGAYVFYVGPVRLRVEGITLLSIREPWRALLAAIVVLAGRIGLRGRVPLTPSETLGRMRVAWRTWRDRVGQEPSGFYGVLTIVSVWLSIGPSAGLWPLVFWMPGLSLIRVPSRFTLLALLGLAVLVGRGFERVAGRMAPRARTPLAVAVGLALLVEAAAIPLQTEAYHVEIPAADRWLATRPRPFAVAEVPLPNPGDLGPWERRQTAFLLHATAHWQKTVHGYSGYRPPQHAQLYEELTAFPDEPSIAHLEALGVTYVVVHTGDYPPEDWPRVEEQLGRFAGRLILVFTDDTGRVYQLVRGVGR